MSSTENKYKIAQKVRTEINARRDKRAAALSKEFSEFLQKLGV